MTPVPHSPWHWHPHPEVWVLVALLIGGYVYAIRRLGPSHVHPIERAVSRGQIALYMTGVAVIWLSADWPVHELAENYLYSVHMMQHLLLGLVAPPLLIMGTPAWLFRMLLPGRLLTVARFLSRPFVALVAFNAVIAILHVPSVVTAMSTNEPFHFAIHAATLTTALMMWMPVLSPIIEIPRLHYPGQMFYLFLQSLVPTVPASFLTFADRATYKIYEEFPRLWNLPAVTDQRIAGLTMKILGGLILWGIIGVLFFKWYARESTEGVDVLTHHSVDRELNRVALRDAAQPRAAVTTGGANNR